MPIKPYRIGKRAKHAILATGAQQMAMMESNFKALQKKNPGTYSTRMQTAQQRKKVDHIV